MNSDSDWIVLNSAVKTTSLCTEDQAIAKICNVNVQQLTTFEISIYCLKQRQLVFKKSNKTIETIWYFTGMLLVKFLLKRLKSTRSKIRNEPIFKNWRGTADYDDVKRRKSELRFNFKADDPDDHQSHDEFCELADVKELLKNFVFDFFLVQFTWNYEKTYVIHQAATGTIR